MQIEKVVDRYIPSTDQASTFTSRSSTSATSSAVARRLLVRRWHRPVAPASTHKFNQTVKRERERERTTHRSELDEEASTSRCGVSLLLDVVGARRRLAPFLTPPPPRAWSCMSSFAMSLSATSSPSSLDPAAASTAAIDRLFGYREQLITLRYS
jgi:hypothetical protein